MTTETRNWIERANAILDARVQAQEKRHIEEAAKKHLETGGYLSDAVAYLTNNEHLLINTYEDDRGLYAILDDLKVLVTRKWGPVFLLRECEACGRDVACQVLSRLPGDPAAADSRYAGLVNFDGAWIKPEDAYEATLVNVAQALRGLPYHDCGKYEDDRNYQPRPPRPQAHPTKLEAFHEALGALIAERVAEAMPS